MGAAFFIGLVSGAAAASLYFILARKREKDNVSELLAVRL
jgi:hypothetical protein